jgi:hypothetical protein
MMVLSCFPAAVGLKRTLFPGDQGKIRVGRGVLIAIVGIVASVSVVAFAVGIASYRVTGQGGVVSLNIEVYEDSNCTVKAQAIDWGILEPGESRNRTLYIKNEGNKALTLFLTTVNWEPVESSNQITVIWDSEGIRISPGGYRAVIVMLTVSPSIAGVEDFRFVMVFQGTG